MTARWLVVVEPDQAAQEPRLRAGFDRRLVEVVLDRRRGDRREGRPAPEPDRRRSDRRGAPDAPFRLDYSGRGFRVYQAVGRVTLQCARCASPLEMELPGFREPPARLSLDVVHDERPSAATLRAPLAAETIVRHSVDVQAHSATGRLILSCRAPARPPEAYEIDADESDREAPAFPSNRRIDP